MPGRPSRFVVLLAALAVVLAACGDDDGAVTADGVTLTADDMFFEPDGLTVPAGTVDVTMVNDGAAEHDLHIEELGDVEVVATVAPGATGSGSIDLEAGGYTFYCSVPGHREAGMEGTLTVTE